MHTWNVVIDFPHKQKLEQFCCYLL